ncbi:hypothetical protein WT60_12075 [Burkholderia sp. MSMB617WGS]|uniref:hypothetical protein n=1 Tax=Burkholderia sp. MSMB617WGS TaxID=1637831 RepID=UPI00075FBEA7|nr:hypothetical protein [Burkholderia sp. MSMB617WGS]AOK47497.1 hypothetical protein WT60_12075 [Burkholderia sp. MSMB617WGS]
MNHSDRPTQRTGLSVFIRRHLRMPLPKLETGRFGWAKRWFVDWLVPTGASAYAAYHLTGAFVRHYRALLPEQVGHGVALDVMSELMSLANSRPFAYTGAALIATLVALVLHRILKRPARGVWLNRRDRPVVYALPFALGLLVGKFLAFAVPALAVAIAAYASEGAIGAVALFAVPIAALSAAYYFLLYDEVRPPSIVTLSFHRPRPCGAKSNGNGGAPKVGIDAWREAHIELQDDVHAIADAAGGMCGQSIFVSHDIDDIVIAVALSVDERDLHTNRVQALAAQIDRVLRKWRGKGYASGSLHDAKATPAPLEAKVSDDAFWLPEPGRVTRLGSLRLEPRSGRAVRVVDDAVGDLRAGESRGRARPRRERTFEFV